MQSKDTAMICRTQLPKARQHLPGLALAEKRIHYYAENSIPLGKGRKAVTMGIHMLRSRGTLSSGTTEFSYHSDEWSFQNEAMTRPASKMPAYTFIVSLGPAPVPPMMVFGAEHAFDYGEVTGSTAAFPSGCIHSSLRAPTEKTTFKAAFFVGYHPATAPAASPAA